LPGKGRLAEWASLPFYGSLIEEIKKKASCPFFPPAGEEGCFIEPVPAAIPTPDATVRKCKGIYGILEKK